MGSVIKSADSGRGVQSIVFNLEDVSRSAGSYVDDVRAQALRIVQQAQTEAATIRKQAEEAGRQDAERRVEQVVEQKLAQQLKTLLPALQQAVAEIRDAKQAWLLRWEGSVVRLATAIAGRIVRRELSRQPELPLPLIREALELAAGGAEVTLRLNPGDHAALAPQIESIVAEINRLAPAHLVADERISAGGCRVETKFGVIDQQFEAQLGRIEEELI
jgi:flagellar assembly protein FliH